MVRLVLDLLQRRSRGDVVPVLMSAASWNPTAQDLYSWLTRQLLIAYPALAAPLSPSDEGSSSRVEALLQARLVMPILDGFDELPEAVRGQAIAEINDQLRPGERLVLTSRTAEYHQAIHPVAGPEVTLAAAQSNRARSMRRTSSPISGKPRAARGVPLAGIQSSLRWHGRGALAQASSNPLMIGLARSIYNPRPGERTDALPDPAELCSFGGRESIEGHPLDGFIPAVYRPTSGRRSHRRHGKHCQPRDGLPSLPIISSTSSANQDLRGGILVRHRQQ